MVKTRAGSRYQPYPTRTSGLAHAGLLSHAHGDAMPYQTTTLPTTSTDISGVLSPHNAQQRCIYQVRSDASTSLPRAPCPLIATTTGAHSPAAAPQSSLSAESSNNITCSSQPSSSSSSIILPAQAPHYQQYCLSASSPPVSRRSGLRSATRRQHAPEPTPESSTRVAEREISRLEPPLVGQDPAAEPIAGISAGAGVHDLNNLSSDIQSDNTTNDLSTLSPYQRVTRNLYRQGTVNDPDIGMDVFDTYAKIRMGTMNMTVSMQKDQVVVFRFDSNPGLNHWPSKPGAQSPMDTSHFPELLPLPPRVEARLKNLATREKAVYEVDELSPIFNELQDVSDSHPVALIMMSILEALDKVPPTGQLDDIALVLDSLESAERLIQGFKLHEPSSFYEFDDTIDEEDDEPIEKCSICLSQLAHSFPLAQLRRCKHMFHSECLTSWHKVKFTCPLCRSHLSPMRVKIVYKRHSK